MSREIKGWHVAMMFCSAFAVIISVNLLLAWKAVATFPGLEVKNSYVASQSFDAKRQAQQALGWRVAATMDGSALSLTIEDSAGRSVEPARLIVTVGRATHVADDFTPEFTFNGRAHIAPVDLAPGTWRLRLRAVSADGTAFEQVLPIQVRG